MLIEIQQIPYAAIRVTVRRNALGTGKYYR